MTERVLVTGATGTTGAAVVDELLYRDAESGTKEGIRVLAATRDPGGYDGPAEPVRFDVTDPDTYDALRAVDAVYLVRPPEVGNVERDLFPVVDAAENRGVRRAVLLSVLGAERVPFLPHRRLERHLEGSALDWTFLRAAYFTQNLETVHAAEIRRGELAVPAGGGRVGMVDARDVAAVATRALLGGHEGRAYDLTGPRAVSFHDVAAALSAELDHEVRFTRPGLVQYAWHRRRAGVPATRVAVECGLYTAARLGLSDRVTDDVREVLGREPRSLAEYVADRRAVWTRDGDDEDRPTPELELVDRPPETLLRVANPLLARLLRSPLHGLVSDALLLLTVTGRRTGTEYTFPVGYERRGDRLFVTTHHTNWWRNVRDGATVEVVLRGERRRGHARRVDDPDEVADYLAGAIDRHGRRYARRLGLRLTGEGRPTRGRLREAAAGEIRLVVIDLDERRAGRAAD